MAILGHWFTLLISRLFPSVSADQLRKIVAELAPDRRSVLRIPWGTSRAQVPNLLPQPVAEAVAKSPGKSEQLLIARGCYLFGVRITLTFEFKEEHRPGLSGLDVDLGPPCRHMVSTLAQLFGPPMLQSLMPSLAPGHPETHTLWAADGFDVRSQMTVYGTGSITFTLPDLEIRALMARQPLTRRRPEGLPGG